MQLGETAPNILPLKVVKVEIGPVEKRAGGTYEALQIVFEKVRGQDAGGQFNKNYAVFRDEAGRIGGPAKTYLQGSAKALNLKAIEDTEQLVGQTFNHEKRTKENKNNPSQPFSEYVPVSVWTGSPANGNGSTTQTDLSTVAG